MASLATSRELRRLLRYLSDKWTVPVLDALADRRRRFGDLRGDCAITSRMLVRTLRSLGDKGIVARSTWPGGRLRVEYELTAFGRSLHTQLVDLQRWAKRRAPADTSITDGNVAAPPRPVAAQTVSDDSHGWSRLGHPGLKLTIATRNIHRASRIFARLFATTTPDISQSDVLGAGGAFSIKLTGYTFENVAVDLVQPMDTEGPFYEYTRHRRGGVHDFGFFVSDAFRERFLWLARHCDSVAFANDGQGFAMFDFRSTLGAHIGLAAPVPAMYQWPQSMVPRNGPFARIDHVGFVVHDIERAAAAYAQVFGVQPSRVRRFTPLFPRRRGVAPTATVKFVKFQQPNIAVHIYEPVGASPMRDYLDRHGNSMYELGFNVGDRFASVRARMKRLGARQSLGSARDRYAQFELDPICGVVIGLRG